MRATYLTATGARLHVLGSDRGPAAGRIITRPQAELEDAIAQATATGLCSVCGDADGCYGELDAAGRCRECQP